MSEIIGPRRKRHAEIAADGCSLPDLERCKEGAAALVDQRRSEPAGWADESIELRNGARGGDAEMALGDGQCRPFQVGQIDEPSQVDLRLREQPGAAREPSITCPPNR
ncbi:hypothetical protein ACVWWG_009121 [Bradyrhizobium sp. LB7.2]